MKAFVRVEPPNLSQAMFRVATALAKYAPTGVELVEREEDADLVVRHVIGFTETVAAVAAAKAEGRDYALIQYCLASTQKPEAADWLPLWSDAAVVWSYYDLVEACDAEELTADFLFYRAPLGVDGDVFRPNGSQRKYRIGTSGYVAQTESIWECAEAVRKLGGHQFHLGPSLGLGEHVVSALSLTDAQVAHAWGQCEYVAGLRRSEGFELPAYEGFACGARPIVFDRPHYRDWLEEHAEYVPEAKPAELVEHLTEVLAKPARPISAAEREAFLERFNWETIASGFWERAL